ncbi:MFS transporter [Hyalangium rubrum]|uniref:MFS transporter n=1 Tax=Hyalangium rubrum TaxID=3103134 RepID=A0ABU5H6J9_9BACT|nr:MFS transporter [Hyalangium sp. s54d21]MDY7229101.1 MFS transporter [Hyalangium sp. s54d21]
MKISPSKLGLLGTLYFVQGMPYGFQAGALAAYARSHGMSLKAIGFLSALYLPWLLKPLWAPLVERYGSERIGARKSWILPMQAGIALACLTASFFPGRENILPLLGLVFLMNLFAATQDIAVDGLAVDLLHGEGLGWGNAVQVVGYKLGSLTGGGLLIWASEYIGWRGIFIAMAVLAAAGMAITLAAHEPPRAASGGAVRMEWREIFGRMKSAMLLPGAGWMLLFIGTYKLGESLSDALYKAFLVDSGFTLVQVGKWSGTWGTVASLSGSILGGLLATRIPLLGAVFVTATLRVFPLLGRWVLALAVPTQEAIIGVTLAEEFFGGALTTAMFAFMMSRVDRRIGAAHYTLLAGIELLGKMPAGPVAGILADDAGWSYAQVFLLGTVLSVAFLLLLIPLRQPRPPASPPATP